MDNDAGARKLTYVALKTLTRPQSVLISVVFGVRALIFTLIFVFGHLTSMRVLTYLALTIETALLGVLALALLHKPLVRHALLYALPMLTLLPVIISFLIVYFVYLNESIYTVHLQGYGGTVAFSTLHTRDFLVHSFPPLEIGLVFVAAHRVARAHTREFWERASRRARLAYGAYVCAAGLLPIAAYSACVEWTSVYHVELGALSLVLTICAPSLVLGAAYLYFMLPPAKRSPPLQAPLFPFYGVDVARAPGLSTRCVTINL